MPPAQRVSDTEVGSSKGAAEQYDPEIVALYGDAAAAQGMTIAHYIAQLEVFPEDQMKHKYRHGKSLVRPNEVKDLPTKMRRLHKWYMKASKEAENWIVLGFKNEHYGYGDGEIMIEFEEIYQLYQMDDIDKAIVSAYCL